MSFEFTWIGPLTSGGRAGNCELNGINSISNTLAIYCLPLGASEPDEGAVLTYIMTV
jgi:hypothetical protein